METAFWHERWRLNEIGFHQDQINPLLCEHWRGVVDQEPPGTVFVPLCGKSLDMAWLSAQGHSVIGVELSAIAVDAFFLEQGLTARQGIDKGLAFRAAAGFRLFCADFFSLKPEHLGPIQAVYDRAALIALPEALQQRYAEHLLHLLPHAPPILLITLEYDPEEMDGPPFSTPDSRVATLFGQHYSIRMLTSRDVLDDHPALRNRGLTRLTEKVYCLRRTAGGG